MLVGALGIGAPAGVDHFHQAAAGYRPRTVYALADSHDELPHNEPAGEFLHLEDAPTREPRSPCTVPGSGSVVSSYADSVLGVR